MKFSLIIPLWNENSNIDELIHQIAASQLLTSGMEELILVNNGSTDTTGISINEWAKQYAWIVPVHLKTNQNYGGGVYEGFKHARTDIVCYIPGDLQVHPDDVIKIHEVYSKNSATTSKLLVKGWRTIRHDPIQTRIISRVYTLLANLFLGLNIKDVNGLPKMFHRSLLNLIPQTRMKSFVFDSQILSLARMNNWVIEEIPVTFYCRREGISSWSKKRLQIYMQVFLQILKLRSLRKESGVPIERLR